MEFNTTITTSAYINLWWDVLITSIILLIVSVVFVIKGYNIAWLGFGFSLFFGIVSTVLLWINLSTEGRLKNIVAKYNSYDVKIPFSQFLSPDELALLAQEGSKA